MFVLIGYTNNFMKIVLEFFTFKAPVELKLEGSEALEKQVYQKLFIDVFVDNRTDRRCAVC